MKKRFLIMILAVLAIYVLAACSAPYDAAAPEPAADMDLAVPVEEPAVFGEEPDMLSGSVARREMSQVGGMSEPSSDFASEFEMAPEAADSEYFLFPILTPAEAGGRRLVYTVSMYLQTTDFLPGMRTLLDAVAETGGYLVRADVRGYDLRNPRPERSADFRFRVPSEQLPAFIVVIENHYNIWSLQQEMEEATARYQQTTWGLDDLREQERLLVEALETAEGDEHVAMLDSLREVRSSIRELEAAQTEIMDTVIYSTIDIQLLEAFLPPDGTPSARPVAAFLVIALFILVAVALVVVFIVKKRSSKKRGALKNADTANTQESDIRNSQAD